MSEEDEEFWNELMAAQDNIDKIDKKWREELETRKKDIVRGYWFGVICGVSMSIVLLLTAIAVGMIL